MFNLPTSCSIVLLMACFDFSIYGACAFAPQAFTSRLEFTASSGPAQMRNNDLNDDIERAARQRAQGGVGETAAGAVLGGLLLDPFGALFGAQLGAKVGAANAVDRAKKEEMARLGVTEDMLRMAEDIGTALQRSNDGLKASQESFETQQSLARLLDTNAAEMYEKAKAAIASMKEDEAKKILLDRQLVQEKLKKVLLSCVEEKSRLEKMRNNVDALEQRAMEIESLLRRNVGAKALQDSGSQFSLAQEDPLLQKFRDMGID